MDESRPTIADQFAQYMADAVDPFDYIAECDITAAGVFAPEQVSARELVALLDRVIDYAEAMDRYKKLLFRKKTREEVGLSGGLDGPSLHATLLGGEKYDDFVHGIIGLITETGEAAEILRDLIVYGKEPDITNVREEGGDILWYLSRLFKWADTTFVAEMKRNILKLRTRHGAGGFDKDRDANRDLDAERRALED